MTTIEASIDTPARPAAAPAFDMKLEAIPIPVADVDRSIRFYKSIGWRLDADFVVGSDFRGVQFTPPGSSCSIHFGKGGGMAAAPGSAHGMFLVVADIEAARAALIARGVEVSAVFHQAPGEAPQPGRHPAGRTYASFATFKDPDGNTWLMQEVTARLPGRVDGNETTFASPADLAGAIRRAATAHGEHEKRVGGGDAEGWAEWYARHIVSEQAGKPLPE